MISRELTAGIGAARTLWMQGKSQSRPGSGRRAVRAVLLLAGGAPLLSGCISVSAPDKPIVIELNINIKQEVIYRLAADAANTIDSNPEIF
ncbi:MAG TPA: YnbE family lipoprotein [Novosphingobium sp.]